MKPAIIIVTGLSGSGKTVALRALEDMNFFCVDNLPVTLIDVFISKLVKNSDIRKIAIGIDIREREFLSKADSVLSSLRKKYRHEIIFLEAETGVIIRRFNETRRPHPLARAENVSLEDCINIEHEMLSSIRRRADAVIDTSSYTPHQLRAYITSLYGDGKKRKAMSVTFISFGYKYGTPQNLDLLFDVRFIPNPFFVPKLKDLTGADKAVKRFVFGKPQTKEFIRKLDGLLNFLIPHYIKEGKTYLTIGIGCTGGKHRSPAITEKISGLIKNRSVYINVMHRDL